MKACYFDHRANADEQCSADVGALDALLLMRRVLDTPVENFVRLEDAAGNCIQFATQPDGSIFVDMPVPEKHGSWQRTATWDHVAALVSQLTDRRIGHLFSELRQSPPRALHGMRWVPFPNARWADLVKRDRGPT